MHCVHRNLLVMLLAPAFHSPQCLDWLHIGLRCCCMLLLEMPRKKLSRRRHLPPKCALWSSLELSSPASLVLAVPDLHQQPGR